MALVPQGVGQQPAQRTDVAPLRPSLARLAHLLDQQRAGAGPPAKVGGVGDGSDYGTDVLPGLLLFSLGLAALVAPLTTTVLAAAADRFAGVASGINNAVARTGSLLAVAALPAAVGIGGEDYQHPPLFTAGYEQAMVVCTVLLVAGGLVSLVGLAGTAPARGASASRR